MTLNHLASWELKIGLSLLTSFWSVPLALLAWLALFIGLFRGDKISRKFNALAKFAKLNPS